MGYNHSMDPAKRRKRVAAGRSGGIFQCSIDASGIPVYEYLARCTPAVASSSTEGDHTDCFFETDAQEAGLAISCDNSSERDFSCSTPCPNIATTRDDSRPNDSIHNSEEDTQAAQPDYPEFEDGYFSTEEEYMYATSWYQYYYAQSESDEESVTEDYDIDIPCTTLRDMRNHYEVLGLTMHSNEKMIASRARQLMSALHPDKVSHRTAEQKTIDAEEFARVSLAKTELLDVELRVLHDREIRAGTWTGVPYN